MSALEVSDPSLNDISVPLRSEVEVASNAVYGVMRARLIPGTTSILKIAEAAGLTVDDLRLAAARYEHATTRSRAVRLVPTPEPTRPGRPAPPASVQSREIVGAAIRSRRKCARCGTNKNLESFPLRPSGLAGRPGRSQVCYSCTESIVREPDAGPKAIAKIRAFLELPEGTTCSVCEREIRAGEHVAPDGTVHHTTCETAG